MRRKDQPGECYLRAVFEVIRPLDEGYAGCELATFISPCLFNMDNPTR